MAGNGERSNPNGQNRERLSPRGLSRRQQAKRALQIALGAVIGTTAAGAFNASRDIDWRDLKTPGEKIDRFRKGKNGFDGDTAFHAAANLPTRGAEQFTRAAYVQNVFLNTIPVKMPVEIRDLLATVAPGVPAQESRYNNNIATSRSGARYIWQLTQPAIDHLNGILKAKVKLEDTQSFSVATPLAFAYFDQVIYPAIEAPAGRVLQKFGLSENPEAAKQFLAYCMVNAYNAGPTRLSEMLDAFVAGYSPRHVHQAYEYTPLSLFQAFAETALRPPGTLSGGYKYEAGEYLFRVLAGAESLNAAYKLKFDKTLPQAARDGSKHAFDMVLQEALKPAAAGLAGGIAGHVVADLYSDRSPTSAMRRLSRRAVLKASGAAAGGVAAHHAYKGNIPMPAMPDIGKWMWWRADEPEAPPTKFADDSVYRPKIVREKLRAIGGESTLIKRPVDSVDLTAFLRNLTSSGVIAHLTQAEISGTLKRISKKDIDTESAAYRSLSYHVASAGPKWRCRGVGMGASQTGVNESRYLRLTRDAGLVLEGIADEFQSALTKAGLAEGWRVRPIVNGLLRSDGSGGTNKGIAGASRNSPHTFGVGIDLSLSKFDIIHDDTKEFFMTSATADERTADTVLVKKLSDVLAGVLKRMHEKGDFVLTFEPKADHYHISAVPRKK